MASLTNRTPAQLLEDMWALIAQEADSLRSAGKAGLEGQELDDVSKRLDRLVRSIRGAIKDSEAFETKQRAYAGDLSDQEVMTQLVKDPGYRGPLIECLKTEGWTVEPPTPGWGSAPKPKPKPKKEDAAPLIEKPKGAPTIKKARSPKQPKPNQVGMLLEDFLKDG
jgi:hypothetical protein